MTHLTIVVRVSSELHLCSQPGTGFAHANLRIRTPAMWAPLWVAVLASPPAAECPSCRNFKKAIPKTLSNRNRFAICIWYRRFMSSRLLLASILCLGTLPLFAQNEIGAASLSGTITDPTSAVIQAAKVTVKGTETGLVRATETNSAGLYLVKLPVGIYDITIEARGFRTAEVKGVKLDVGSAITVDVPLQVGAVADTVDVTAETPLVEATRSSTSTSVSARAVADLPVNGRNFIDFTTLTPGVIKDPTTSRSGDLSFAGQKGPANSLLVDGADSNNLFFAQATGRTGFRPYAFSQDAVQEFQVNANSFPAEVGRAAGGAINVITKSGTNEFHGSAFEFYRDKGMNANTFTNNRSGLKKAVPLQSVWRKPGRSDREEQGLLLCQLRSAEEQR